MADTEMHSSNSGGVGLESDGGKTHLLALSLGLFKKARVLKTADFCPSASFLSQLWQNRGPRPGVYWTSSLSSVALQRSCEVHVLIEENLIGTAGIRWFARVQSSVARGVGLCRRETFRSQRQGCRWS